MHKLKRQDVVYACGEIGVVTSFGNEDNGHTGEVLVYFRNLKYSVWFKPEDVEPVAQ